MTGTPANEALAAALKADYEVAKTRGVSVKMIAEEFAKSQSWTFEMIRGEKRFPLDMFPVWTRLTGGKYVAQRAADHADCDLVPRGGGMDGPTTLVATMKEATEAVCSAGQALEDGIVTLTELEDYRKEMTEAIEHLRKLGDVLENIHRTGQFDDGRASTLREACREAESRVATKGHGPWLRKVAQ